MREIFHSAKKPTQETHGEYAFSIGPFRTLAEAEAVRDVDRVKLRCVSATVTLSQVERLAA